MTGNGSSTFLQILKLGRLHFLMGGFLLFTLGYLLATGQGDFDIFRYLLGYSIMFTAQLSVSYSNDYFDMKVDRMGQPTPVSGGSGVLVKNPSLAPLSKKLALSLIFFSILLSIAYIMNFSGGFEILVLVLFGNALGWYYTAPPIKLAYSGLGEVTNILSLGIVMPLWGYYCGFGSLDSSFLVLTMPFLFYGTYFIISVQMPDMNVDRLGKKWTFVARKGRRIGAHAILMASILATLQILLLLIIAPVEIVETTLYAPMFAILLASLLPLASSIAGLALLSNNKISAAKYATANVGALMMFGAIANFSLFFHFHL